MHLDLSISPIAHVKKPQRSPLRLRFLTCTLEEISCAICTCYLCTVPYGDKITCIAGTDNNAVLGASQAIAAANMKGKIVTCGVIGNREDAEMIKNDECSYGVFVYWPAIGTLCGEIAQKQYLGEDIPERSNIELFDMTKENCDELLDEYCPE